MTIMTVVVHRLYGIHLSDEFLKTGAVVLTFTIAASLIGRFVTGLCGYIVAVVIIVAASYYSMVVSKKKLKIDLIQKFKEKYLK